MPFDDPAFWRAGAISTTVVMAIVLAMLTIDSLEAIAPGGSHVPPYTVINRHIDYAHNAKLGRDMPVIGKDEPLFGNAVNADEAGALIERGKLVIQSRALHRLPHLHGERFLLWPRPDQGLARSGLGSLGGDHRGRE
jgi:hypothetical protein